MSKYDGVESYYSEDTIQEHHDRVLTDYENETFTSCTWRFFEGFDSLRKWSGGWCEYDSQRSKMYTSERIIRGEGDSFSDLSKIRKYYKYFFSLKSFQRRFNLTFDELEVEMKKKGSYKSSARWDGSPYLHTHLLRFKDNCNNVKEETLLHELAHILAPPPHAPHGRLFASILLWLVNSRMGKEMRDLLLESYRENNVKYSPRKEVQVFNQEPIKV